MSGHSKWASIKHKKQAADAKRGKVFTKLIREITVAAREGGGNPDMNPRLRTAMDRAREANMPQNNVSNAIKRGTGEMPGMVFEEIMYEGYGPDGVAVLVQVLTDNKNRTSAEVRNIFSKRNGNMASANAVAWMFNRKGYILVKKSDIEEEKLMEIALEAGAEDIKAEDENFEVICAIDDFENVKKALTDNNVPMATAELTMLPINTIKVTGSSAKQVLGLIEALEDHDDVQNVYSNFDIPEEELEALSKEEG